MTTFRKLLMAGAITATAMAFANTAQAEDQTGNASADIQAPIVITEDTAMDFATIIADPLGDTVTLTTGGAISATGASTFSGTPEAGEFSATGTPSAAITVSFTPGSLSGPGGATMALSNFVDTAPSTFSGTGAINFNVGADLGVNAGQNAGAYTGTYTVTVDYN